MKNIPPALLEDLKGLKGYDEAAFIAAHDQQPATSVRINPAKDAGLFSANEKVPWCTGGVYLPERPVFTLDPAYHAGAYYVQEASSMFLDHLLRQLLKDKTNLRVLDLCAAPGGKSTLIASLLDKDSLLISNDVIRTRATILEENMTRWGYINTWVTSNDPRDLGRLKGYFDVIVVDAPCSGSGLWRKDAKAVDEWSEANVQLCSERQQRILADVWPALKEDGILVYATCSYSPAEDEEILDWIAQNYEVNPLAVDIEETWGVVPVSSVRGMNGYRFFPHKVRGEGFFIAAVQKSESCDTLHEPRFKTAHDKKVLQHAAYLLKDSDLTFIQTGAEQFAALRPGHEADWQLLSKLVYFRKAGLQVGHQAAKEWVPAHEVALSIDACKQLPCIDVDRDQALRFLKREDIHVEGMAKGWLLVRYNGLGLGWVKSLGNRVNNYLPKTWRIRMDIPE